MTGTVEELKQTISAGHQYRIRLHSLENGLLTKIHQLSLVKSVLRSKTQSNLPEIDIVIDVNQGSISKLFEEIIGMGAQVNSFCEKERSLEALFFEISDTYS